MGCIFIEVTITVMAEAFHWSLQFNLVALLLTILKLKTFFTPSKASFIIYPVCKITFVVQGDTLSEVKVTKFAWKCADLSGQCV